MIPSNSDMISFVLFGAAVRSKVRTTDQMRRQGQ